MQTIGYMSLELSAATQRNPRPQVVRYTLTFRG